MSIPAEYTGVALYVIYPIGHTAKSDLMAHNGEEKSSITGNEDEENTPTQLWEEDERTQETLTWTDVVRGPTRDGLHIVIRKNGTVEGQKDGNRFTELQDEQDEDEESDNETVEASEDRMDPNTPIGRSPIVVFRRQENQASPRRGRRTRSCRRCGKNGHSSLLCEESLVDGGDIQEERNVDVQQVGVLTMAASFCANFGKPVRRIERSVRDMFAKLSAEVLKIANDTCESTRSTQLEKDNAMEAFLFLPRILEGHQKVHAKETVERTITNITSECDNVIDKIIQLREECVRNINLKRRYFAGGIRKRSKAKKLVGRTKGKVYAYIRAGQLGKAVTAIKEHYDPTTTALYDSKGNVLPEVTEKLMKLFPDPGFKEPLPATETVASEIIDLSKEEVEGVIRAAPRASSAGGGLWTNELIKYICDKQGAHTVIVNEETRRLIINMANCKAGSRSVWVKPVLNLVAKAEQGALRPIMVESIFMRLMAKCTNRMAIPFFMDEFKDTQYGIGVSGGVEKVAHTVSIWCEEVLSRHPSGKLICHLDDENAFPTISRNECAAIIIKHAKDLYPLFHFLYAEDTPVYFNDGVIAAMSKTGIWQGNGLSQLIFSAVQAPILKEAKEKFEVKIVAIADDKYIYGYPDKVASAIDFISDRVREMGGKINLQKSQVLAHKDDIPLIRTRINAVSTEGIKVLGCYYGKRNYVQANLDKLMEEMIGDIDLIASCISPKQAIPLIRSCINTRASYMARICQPWYFREYAKQFDMAIDKAIARGIGINGLPEVASWVRSLPGRLGGIGMQSMEKVHEAAWSASFLSAVHCMEEELQDRGAMLPHHLTVLRKFAEEFDFDGFIMPDNIKQRTFTEKVHQVTIEDIEKNLTLTNKAKLAWFRSQIGNGAGWLAAAMMPEAEDRLISKGYYVSNIKMRLLIDMVPQSASRIDECSCRKRGRSAVPVPTSCIVMADPVNNYHFLTCPESATETIHRHDKVVELVKEISRNIVGVIVKDTVPLMNPRCRSVVVRPDAVIAIEGTDYVVDVRMVNQGDATYREKSKEKQLKGVENAKEAKYKNVMEGNGIFVPFALDYSGNLGIKAKLFLAKISALKPHAEKIFYRKLSLIIAASIGKVWEEYGSMFGE